MSGHPGHVLANPDIKGTSTGHQSKSNGHQRDIKGTSKGHRTGHVRTCSGHVADMYRHKWKYLSLKPKEVCASLRAFVEAGGGSGG